MYDGELKEKESEIKKCSKESLFIIRPHISRRHSRSHVQSNWQQAVSKSIDENISSSNDD